MNQIRGTGILPVLFDGGMSFTIRLLMSVLFYIAVLAFGYGFGNIADRPLLILFPIAAFLDTIRFIISLSHWTSDAVTTGVGAIMLLYLTFTIVRFLLGRIPIMRLLSVALAIIFIYAAVPKILEVNEFARAIRNYHMLPTWSLNLLALWLPWMELIAGGCMIFRVWERGGNILILGMLIVFTAGIISAVARGLDIDCGCFGRTASQLALAHRVGIQKIAENLGMVIISVLLLLPPLQKSVMEGKAK
jgi:hypothetical protein